MKKQYLYALLIILIIGCKQTGSSAHPNYGTQIIESEHEYENQNGFPDGIYAATVDYHNEETNYSAKYFLEVEVENNEVTVIYFSNGGHLDEDHITPELLDSDGYVLIFGEEGKSYAVQLDVD